MEPLKLLLEHRDNPSHTSFVFHQPSILIGHHESADLRLPYTCVSNRQFYLQMFEGRLFGLVLSQNHPTRWKSSGSPWAWITENDAIAFGPYTIRVVEGIRANAPGNASGDNPLISAPSEIPPLLLENHSNPNRTFRGTINRSLSLIGSSGLCKFRIQSESVSSIHCSLVRTSEGIWAANLAGREGIRLNNVSCRFGKLEEGDQLDFGKFGFRVRYQSPLPAFSSDGAEASPMPLVENNGTENSGPSSHTLDLGEWAAQRHEPASQNTGAMLELFATFQNQIDQQFQDLLDKVVQMFGLMLTKQQDHFAEERKRYDELTRELANLQRALGGLPDAIPQEEPPFAVPEPVPEEPPFALTQPLIRAPEPKFDPQAPMPEGDMHVWLQGRIAEIQNQRRTLLSRLKGMITGNPESA